MSKLCYSSRSVSGAIVVEVHGDLDYDTAETLWDQAAAFIDPRRPVAVVDLAGIDYLDSSGLSTLVELWKRADRTGVSLRFAAPGQHITRMLEWTGLDRHLPIFPDVDAAVDTSGR